MDECAVLMLTLMTGALATTVTTLIFLAQTVESSLDPAEPVSGPAL